MKGYVFLDAGMMLSPQRALTLAEVFKTTAALCYHGKFFVTGMRLYNKTHSSQLGFALSKPVFAVCCYCESC